MRLHSRILIPAAFTLFVSGAAVSFSASQKLTSRPIDPPAAPDSMGPSLTVSGDDVLLTWLEPLPSSPSDSEGHRLRFSRLSGDRWSAPVTIASGSRFFANWADFPGAVQALDGSLVTHWLERSGGEKYSYGVKLARSTDRGATWAPAGSLHPPSGGEHGFVSWVPEKEGVRAFWLDGRDMKGESEEAGAMTLFTASFRGAKAANAANEEKVDSRVCSCCQTDAALAAGGPVIAYRDRSDEEVRDISVIRRTPKGWSQPVRVHADNWKIPGCPVNGPAIAASGRHVAVAWFTSAPPNPRVYVAFSEDGGATFGPAALVDGDKPLGRVDLLLDGKGDALVSWLAVDGQGASVRLRRVTPKGTLGQPLPIAATSAARNSGFPRMALNGGRLILAWVENGEASKLRAVAIPVATVR